MMAFRQLFLGTLLKGKWVIRGFGRKRQLLKDSGVYVEGETMKHVDAYSLLKQKYRPEFEYGTQNHVVMPGLVNSHGHGRGPSNLERGIKDGPLEL